MADSIKSGKRHSASDQAHMDQAMQHLADAGAQMDKQRLGALAASHDDTDADDATKRVYSDKEREQLAKEGKAKPDGSYPIVDRQDLENAVRAWGRGGATASDKEWIIKRAKALDATDLLPEDWEGSTKKPDASKSVDLSLLIQRVRGAWSDQHPLSVPLDCDGDGDDDMPVIAAVLDDSLVLASAHGDYYRVGYQQGADGEIVFAPVNEWKKTEPTWSDAEIKLLAASKVVSFGDAIKVLARDGSKVTVGGYLVRYGDDNHTDASEWRDFFAPDTDYGFAGKTYQSHTWFHHTLPVMVKSRGGMSPMRITREFEPAELERDDIGIFAKSVLDERDEYEKMLAKLAQAGALGWSSGTAKHLIKRTEMPNGSHRVDRWILGDDASYTHTPAEPRNAIYPLEAVKSIEIKWDAVEDKPASAESQVKAQAAVSRAATAPVLDLSNEAIKSILKEFDDMDQNQFNAALAEALKAPEVTSALKTANQSAVAATVADEIKKLRDEPAANAGQPMTTPAAQVPAYNKTSRGDDGMKALTWYLKTGDPGGIRTGPAYEKARMQGDLEAVKTDYSLLEGTQYQGQEAVPTEVWDNIIKKRDPLSIMRAGGATVINAKSNAMTVPIEKASPQQFGIVTIDGTNTFTTLTQQPIDKLAATIYLFTYNLPYDIQLIDDATFSIEGWGSQYVARGLALTENNYFLMGTGSGQPQGAVYGGSTGVTAASATAVTAAEVSKLYYTLPTEYQDNVVWVMATATHGAVRSLGAPQYGFAFVGNGGFNGGAGMGGFPQGAGWLVDVRSRVFTSAAMDALAASKKPISAMNPQAGYAIIDRTTLTVLRDPYSAASTGRVQVWFYARFSGGIVNSTAIQNLVTPSA